MTVSADSSINTARKSYDAIDVMRYICALLVVAIHSHLLMDSAFGYYFTAMSICSIAVPFFYVCSGFFLFGKFSYNDKGKIEKNSKNLGVVLNYEKRLVITYCIWSVIYFAYKAFLTWRANASLSLFAKKFIKDFFLNGSEYHLWYVICLIYAVPIVYLFLRFIGQRGIPVLMMLTFVLGQFYEGYRWLNTPYHSFLRPIVGVIGYGFMVFSRAVPFICAGMLLRLREFKPGKGFCLAAAALSFVLGGAETLAVHRYWDGVNLRYNMFLLPTVFFLFAFFTKLTQGDSRRIKKAAFLRQTSSFVYFVHPLILGILTKLLQIAMPSFTQNSVIVFSLLAVCSTFAGMVVVATSKKIKLLKYTF